MPNSPKTGGGFAVVVVTVVVVSVATAMFTRDSVPQDLIDVQGIGGIARGPRAGHLVPSRQLDSDTGASRRKSGDFHKSTTVSKHQAPALNQNRLRVCKDL